MESKTTCFKPKKNQFTGAWKLKSLVNQKEMLRLLGFSSFLQKIIPHTQENFKILFREKGNKRIFHKNVVITCKSIWVQKVIDALGFDRVSYNHQFKLKKRQEWENDDKRFGPVRTISSYDKMSNIYTLIWQWPEPDEKGSFPKELKDCTFKDKYCEATRWMQVDHQVKENELIVALKPTSHGETILAKKIYERVKIPTTLQNQLNELQNKFTLL